MANIRCPSCLREFVSTGCSCGYPEKGHNASHQLPVGTLLRGRYQIGKCLGQGGFGITYLAWDMLMLQSVAVKEFYPGGTVFRRSATSLAVECSTEEIIPHYEYSKERFLREASALVKFKDIPEIVDILDFAEENNTAYIIMEYIRGVDLAKYIGMKGGKLSVDETFRILKPVMEALAKVHKGGIVHRDISPDNIILDPMGGAKLLDFGAVRAVENPDVEHGLNKSTEAILKQGFAPIEQYNSRGSLGPWTDEYAMCATVFYCLTGKIPEDASIRMSEGIDPDWSAIPGLPEHQRKALEKGIACRAKDRFRSLDELLDALFPEKKKGANEIVEATEAAVDTKKPHGETTVLSRSQKKTIGKKSSAGILFLRIITSFILLAVIATVSIMIIPKQLQYSSAEALMEEGHFQEAIVIFGSIEDYRDSSDRILECYYLQADALLAEGKLGEAAIQFGNLSGYADSRERSFEIWDQIAPRDTICTGDDHTLALKNDGSVVSAEYSYWKSDDIKAWTDIVSVSVGTYHAVGLKADGTVVAVGLNSDGQCNVSEWSDIVAISAGGYHTVGLCADGSVIAVGYNLSSACNTADWTDIVSISAGNYHTVGLKVDGTVVAVGYNSDGQCKVSNWTNIISISAGDMHTIGLQADGTVVAAGHNDFGQCDVSGWQGIVAINAGTFHSVGVLKNGTVKTTGQNSDKSSSDNYGGSLTPWEAFALFEARNARYFDISDWSNIVAVSVDNYYAVGLQKDGTVIATGYNSSGQCDVSDWTDICIPKKQLPFR